MWPSPISVDLVVGAAIRLGEVAVSVGADGTSVWWSETRPAESGRTQIVRLDAGGHRHEVLPAPLSCASRVHEYGGGAWWLAGETLYWVHDVDQRIYRLERGSSYPSPVTPEPSEPRSVRYADGVVTGQWIIVVQEVHLDDAVLNRLVAVPLAGGEPVVLFDRSDFVAAPRVDPSGTFLAFVTWNDPNMPWDSTTLWSGVLSTGDGQIRFDGAPVLGEGSPTGGDVSITQPSWDASGRLWCISDQSDWWNLYRWPEPGAPAGAPESIAAMEAEVGEPAWVFGQRRYGFLADGRVVFAARSGAADRLYVVAPDPNAAARELAVPPGEYVGLTVRGSDVVVIAGAPTAEPAVWRLECGGADGDTPSVQVVRPSRSVGLTARDVSVGQHVSFPSGESSQAHALFYPPTHRELAPQGELPPAVVMLHGGPNSHARNELRLATQFWTSRGFAVIDLDYRGSTGYGRAYRNQLRGAWGVADVEDCVGAVRALADRGLIDPERVCVRGGSAGGFTALAALTFTDAFAAGASYYGVTDLALLAQETHKFEARYLDSLVGPYPEAAAVYRDRSPLEHVELLKRPVIVLQGSEDRVVPPSQASALVDALADRGVPHAYLLFEGEGHGFRRPENIRTALLAEWSFYLQILGIPLPEGVTPVEVIGQR